MGKDYYKILGTEKNASPDEIKAAFRRLAMEHHPDRGGNPEKFKEINEAYQVLSNPEKRSQYDQFGTTYEGMAGGPFRWEDMSSNFDFGNLGDIFGDFFSAQGGPASGWGDDVFGARRTSRGRGTRARRGKDIQMDLTVDFLESIFGAEKEISLYKDMLCAACGGEGAAAGSKKVSCKTCGGTGQIVKQSRILFGTFQSVAPCPDCGGAGQRAEKNCPECGGAGAVKGEETLLVKIPAGISDGEAIRLSGKGEAGRHGAPAGDLYVRINVRPDKRFEREGFDILNEKEITFSQAALGTAVEIETVDGAVELKIPAGIQSGEVIRLRNKGVPHLGGSGRGDHLVTIIVKTPRKLSKRAKRLLEELEEEGI
jgi:molecular chaperone DnaJ